MLQILGKFIIFKDLQMIEKSLFDIFNHIKVRKNAPSLHLQVSPRTLWVGRWSKKFIKLLNAPFRYLEAGWASKKTKSLNTVCKIYSCVHHNQQALFYEVNSQTLVLLTGR